MNGSAGKKPRLTKNGKTMTCRINNHVPLVVPGLSTNSGSRASSTSPSRDQFSTDLSEEQREVAASKNGSGQSTKCENQKKKKERRSDADDRLQGLLEWSEPFTDNLADTEIYAPAQVSEDSDSERVTKVTERLRKQSIFKTHWRSRTKSREVW